MAGIFTAARTSRAAGLLVCAACLVALLLLLPDGAAAKAPKPPKTPPGQAKKQDKPAKAPKAKPANPPQAADDSDQGDEQGSGDAAGSSGSDDGPVDITQAPTIGNAAGAHVGTTLTAQAGTWSGPAGTLTGYQWWRCPTTAGLSGCALVSSGTPEYTLAATDVSQYIFLVLYAWHGHHLDYALSQPTAAVTTPPVPSPVFEVNAQPIPVTNAGALLNANSKSLKFLQPFPIVRMRGRLTLNGARVTLFSVRAPRHVRITVTCAGPGCRATPWGKSSGTRTLTRITPFERTLPAGMRITVNVTRAGYVGKHSVFWIRRGLIPRRVDECLYPGGKARACPSV